MKTRYVVIQAYLHTLAFALMTMGGMALLGYLQLEQPTRHNVVLLPDSALTTLVMGLLLLGAARRNQAVAWVAASFLWSITLYTLVHNYWAGGNDQGVSLISGFLRIRSALAIVIGLAALAILVSSMGHFGKLFCRAVGLGVIALGVFSQLATWLPELDVIRLGFKAESTSIANLFTLAVGGTCLMLPLPSRSAQLLDRLTLTAGLVGTLLTAVSWYLLSLNNIESVSRQSELVLSEMQSATKHDLETHISSIQRMAERWENLGQLPTPAFWNQEAGSYLRDISEFRLLGLLDEHLHPQQLLLRKSGLQPWLQYLLEEPDRRQWLREMQKQTQPNLGRPLQLPGDPATALIVQPLRLPGKPTWLLIAGLSVEGILHESGEEIGGFVVQLFDGQQLIFNSRPNLDSKTLVPIGEHKFQPLPGLNWRLLSFMESPQELYRNAYLPTLIMVFGLSFSFFLMLSQRLSWLAMERTKRLRLSNRQLESSLQHQASLQALNQRIMQYSMDLLCSIDANGSITQLSASARKILGYSPQELIGKNYLDFVLLEDRDQTRAAMDALMNGHSGPGFRNRYRRKDGSTVYLLWSAGWSEEDRTLFAVAHDITRLVHSEAYTEDQRDILSLISTERPLTEILEAICHMTEAQTDGAQCVVMLLDKDSQHLQLGAAPSLPPAFSRALEGLPVSDASACCGTAVYLQQLIVVEDIAKSPHWNGLRHLALSNGLHSCWSIPLLSHRREVLGTFAIYHPHPGTPGDDEMQLMAISGQLAAIAIKRQQNRLRMQESEQRYRSLFTFNPDPVFSLNLYGDYESMNQAGCELSGYREEELFGQNYASMVLPEEVPRISEHFRAARAGEPQHFEVKAQNRKGEVLELDITNLPIIVDEKIVGVFGIAKDISERNRMTRALREALQRSEHQAELLRGLNETAVTMSGIFNSQALLDYMVKQMRLLIGAHQAFICLMHDSGWGQSISAVSLSEKYQAEDHQAWSESELHSMVWELSQPLVLTQEELENHPRWNGLSDKNTRHPPMRGWLAVPLKDPAGNNLGLLQLSDKHEGEFDQDDLAVAQQFAQMAAAVLENNRLMREVIAGERRLQTQLDFTSAITDSTAEGLLAIGQQGLLTFVNPAAAELIGQPAANLLGQPLAEFLPLPLGDWPLADDEQSNQHGEFSLCDNDHKRRYMAFDSAPLLDSSGPNGWVVAIRDISAQRLANQAMRERDQFFTLSLEMFCMLNLEGNFTQVNSAFVEVLGYPADRLIGQSYLELIHPEDRPSLSQEIRRLPAGESIQDLEVRVMDARDNLHWLQLSAAQGEDQVIYCAARDITERKAGEQVLRETLEELERSNSELQEFAFVASHDLQEPLRKIQAFAERLETRAEGMDEESREYLKRMISAAGRMQSLIRDLLAYSRVTTRGQPFQQINLNQILDEVLQDLETAVENSAAQIEREPLPAVLGDPMQMRQLLQNLLSNAIKFHPEGHPPHVRVYAEHRVPGEWTLCVTDQGIGFDEKYLDRIFNPFQRLHGKQAYPGTGIGLAIVKKIVQRHGAQITATSRPGHGTTFRITFKSLG